MPTQLPGWFRNGNILHTVSGWSTKCWPGAIRCLADLPNAGRAPFGVWLIYQMPAGRHSVSGWSTKCRPGAIRCLADLLNADRAPYGVWLIYQMPAGRHTVSWRASANLVNIDTDQRPYDVKEMSNLWFANRGNRTAAVVFVTIA